MKVINFLALGIAALGMLLSSCNETDNGQEVGSASLKITIAGAGNDMRGNGEPDLSVENTVHSFVVYVADANTSRIQSVSTFTSPLTQTIEDLTTGSKKVIVVANGAEAGLTTLAVGDVITKLNETSLSLDTQTAALVSANGLVMSGEATVTLVAGANTLPSTLQISRVAAKIRLGTVTYSPAAGETGTFVLEEVAIMKARGSSSYGPGTIYFGPVFFGGMTGTVSTTVKPYLTEAISLTDNAERFFYVLPNDNVEGNATLLTLKGQYNNVTKYFPVRINDVIGTGGDTTDGTYVTRNTIYTINITIVHPGEGSPDPELPVDPATLTITVGIANWFGPLIQNVEF